MVDGSRVIFNAETAEAQRTAEERREGMHENEVSQKVIGCAIEVKKTIDS
jgi:hypothetical protein